MTKEQLAKELREEFKDIVDDTWTDDEIINCNETFTPFELVIAIRVSRDKEQFFRIKDTVEKLSGAKKHEDFL